MNKAYIQNDSYNSIPPAGAGIENGGLTNTVQALRGQKTVDSGTDTVNGMQVNADNSSTPSGYSGFGFKDASVPRFFLAFNPVTDELRIRSRNDDGTARSEVINIPRATASEITLARQISTRGPVLYPAANSLSSALTTISALDITGYSFIALTGASAITLNSFALSAGILASNVGFAINMRISAGVICTIKHNVPAGGIPFLCPNSVDYIIPATMKNKIYTVVYCPISGVFFVS